MCKFYYPNGTEAGKDEFIKFYNQVYYYMNRNLNFENQIDRILESDTLTRRDVVDIFRWKIGATSFDYTSEVAANQWGSIDVGKLMDSFDLDATQEKFEKKELLKGSPEGTLRFLTEQDGIGPVYAITMLYFITQGEYPIYDRFAKMALSAILKPAKPGELIQYTELPDKSRKTFLDIMKKEMDVYQEQIKSAFGKRYWENRNIDRALWAYGHLFKQK